MDDYATQEFAPGPQVHEGRTEVLEDWEVDERNDEWCLTHYVGGEEYEICWGIFDTYDEAKAEANRLNALVPPLKWTHTYIIE